MKIYLASRYSRRDELREVRSKLHDAGHVVTSRWLMTEWSLRTEGAEGSTSCPADRIQEYFQVDCDDIKAADAFVAFTSEPRSGGRGGYHVEWGMAIAWNKALFVVGPAENLFYHAPSSVRVDTVDGLLRALAELAGRRAGQARRSQDTVRVRVYDALFGSRSNDD